MSEFIETVRTIVRKIPTGTTRTYGSIARDAGKPKAARAVARIMSSNYDPTVPCHRVVGADGALRGYNRGGTEAKATLLRSEGVTIRNNRVVNV